MSERGSDFILGIKSPWKDNDNPIWLATFLTFHRNIDKYNFPSKLDSEKKKQLVTLIEKETSTIAGLKETHFFPAENIGPLEKQFLYEHFLLHTGLGQAHVGEGFILGKEGSFLAMLNLEDHLSLQLIDSKGELDKSFSRLMEIENGWGKSLSYAFSPRFGFLTADPGLCGSAFEVSCYLQVPALIQTGALGNFLAKHGDDSIFVTGLQGTLDEITGDLLIIRNNYTLGLTEEDILSSVQNFTTKLLVHEKGIRSQLKGKENRALKDKVSRAFAILSHSYQIEPIEALGAISLVKLGVDLGWIQEISNTELNDLFFNCRRAHLLSHFQKELSQEEIPHSRAEFIHSIFKKAKLAI